MTMKYTPLLIIVSVMAFFETLTTRNITLPNLNTKPQDNNKKLSENDCLHQEKKLEFKEEKN